jgi:hypothetical protein
VPRQICFSFCKNENTFAALEARLDRLPEQLAALNVPQVVARLFPHQLQDCRRHRSHGGADGRLGLRVK